MTRIALIADIHGNILALEAVLADITRQGVDQILDLGDVAHGSLDPGTTVRRLREAGIPSIQGNTDRMLLASVPDDAFAPDYHFARAQFAPEDLAWLAQQPASRRVEGIYACHASPTSDTTALLESIGPRGVSLGTEIEIADRLRQAGPDRLVATAHSHLPRVVRLGDGRLCVNPGSVGLPAYHSDSPQPHRMEAGSPHARYAIVERHGSEWGVTQRAVPYDWDAAADRALANGRADRARWLRTGRAPE